MAVTFLTHPDTVARMEMLNQAIQCSQRTSLVSPPQLAGDANQEDRQLSTPEQRRLKTRKPAD
ncbi:MAG: hypothetical protein R3C28_26250 [Pirellulaceae bacterium]